MLSRLKQYVFSGVKSHHKDETNRRILVVNLFAAVGMSITFLLGTRALIDAEYSLSTTLYIASVAFCRLATVTDTLFFCYRSHMVYYATNKLFDGTNVTFNHYWW